MQCPLFIFALKVRERLESYKRDQSIELYRKLEQLTSKKSCFFEQSKEIKQNPTVTLISVFT